MSDRLIRITIFESWKFVERIFLISDDSYFVDVVHRVMVEVAAYPEVDFRGLVNLACDSIGGSIGCRVTVVVLAF